MRKLAAAIATGALVFFGLTLDAGAQSLNDLPAGGPEFCAGAPEYIQMGKDAGTPFTELATAFEETFFNPACGVESDDPGDDGGDDGDNPAPPAELCTGLSDLVGAFEENDAPAELTGGLRDLLAAIGCGGDDDPEPTTTTTTQASTTTTQATTTTTAAVLGETETAGQTGTALPATGGGLLGAASAGISFLALSSIIRRFFR